MKAFGPTPQIAQECAQGIFELVKTTQAQIIAPYIEEAKVKLLDSEGRLAKAKDLVGKASRSGSAMGAAYLSTRDEIRYLLDEISALKNVVVSNQNRTTRLVASIYASDIPVAPKNKWYLLLGYWTGSSSAYLLYLVEERLQKLKAKSMQSFEVLFPIKIRLSS